jgi:hypothetical protein
MENRSLKEIDAELRVVREKLFSAIDSADRRNFLLAFQLLNAERVRHINERLLDIKP